MSGTLHAARMRFLDRVCIVTGAGSGIGKATAKQLGQEGGKVTIADLNEEHGRKTAQDIADSQGQALFVKCDVGDPNDIRNTVSLTVQKWGKIDVLVNNAAMMTFQPIHELADDQWDKVLNVNL